MPRKAKGLTAAKVEKGAPGRYGDGDGLYLLVRSPEARFWVFRYVRGLTENGKPKMREMGLGPASGRSKISLTDAREKAKELRDLHRRGLDPLEERAAKRAAEQLEKASSVTFAECAERYIEAKRPEWHNAKHAQQWENTIATFATPVLGSVPVQSINNGLILKVVQPIWTTKTETAVRLRGRLEAILDWAKASGYRQGENPARWKGNLKDLLPNPSKVRNRKHHAALPYNEMPVFMTKLQAEEGTAALALEFTILTAARTGEVIGARWSEFDMHAKLWIVPADRMKARKKHRVPLAPRAIAILKQLNQRDHAPDDYVFEGRASGTPLSNMAFLMLLRRMGRGELTTHGFRSTFRDWAAERTNYPNEVCEMALAHAVSDDVEAAYRRGDLLAKRHKLAAEWAAFCGRPPIKHAKGDRVVVPMRRRRAAQR